MAHYSILDLVPITLGSDAACALERSKQLAIKAESWGYHRYWVAEHSPDGGGTVWHFGHLVPQSN
jgi:alkanesulfonate monooxygenase SsuD/methylene tetrahydromethanopterin reductase-like flavin-dependent oxidoreductase (luciferase family)